MSANSVKSILIAANNAKSVIAAANQNKCGQSKQEAKSKLPLLNVACNAAKSDFRGAPARMQHGSKCKPKQSATNTRTPTLRGFDGRLGVTRS